VPKRAKGAYQVWSEAARLAEADAHPDLGRGEVT
jgi:hypothetical protein